MKRIIVSVMTTVLLVGFLTGCGLLPVEPSPEVTEGTRDTAGSSPEVSVPRETEDPTVIPPSGIRLVDGVTPEMQNASFWSKDRTVLMTPEEIAAANAANPLTVTFTDASGGKQSIRPYEIADIVPGETVREIINECPFPTAENALYKDGEKLPQSYWDAIEENCQLGAIPASVTPRYAIAVKRTIAGCYPTADFFSDDINDDFYSGNVMSEIFPGEALVVLHETADGEWLYVLAGSFGGWVPSADAAFCGSRDEWLAAAAPEKFLVVTGERIVLDTRPTGDTLSGAVFFMGTKLRLLENAPDSLYERATYGAYVVALPTRGGDGKLLWEPALVPVSAAVSEGYLALSPAAVLEQAFRFLGRIYGWGGSFDSNDCSGITRQIMRCFGIELPRNSGDIVSVRGFLGGSFSDETASARGAVLTSIHPGSILWFPGHIMIYLGTVNGVPYVISSCGMFAPAAPAELGTETVNCILICPMTVRRGSGKTWLEAIERFIELRSR